MTITRNKKILGATTLIYNNIKFKSKLEMSCYKKLQDSNLDFKYESEKFILLDGYYPNIKVLAPNKIGLGKYSKLMTIQNKKIRSITYTPDFIIKKNEYTIYIDVKGKENDTYPLKKKLFLKLINKDSYNIFIEPHSIKQMEEAIKYMEKL